MLFELQPKTLVLVCGAPGSGKSTLAQALVKALPLLLLDKDCLDEAFSPSDRGNTYDRYFKWGSYQALLNLAALNLRLGKSVLVDAPLTHNLLAEPVWTDRILNISLELQAHLRVLQCIAPMEVLRERLEKRGLKRDAAKLTEAGFTDFLRDHRLDEDNPLPHEKMVMTAELSVLVQQALAYIQHRPDR